MLRTKILEWARHVGYLLCLKHEWVSVDMIEAELMKRGIITTKTPRAWRANALRSSCFVASGTVRDKKTGRLVTRFVLEKKKFQTARAIFADPPKGEAAKKKPKKLPKLKPLPKISHKELLEIVLCYVSPCLTCNAPACKVDSNRTERCAICAPSDATWLPMGELIQKLGEMHATGEGYAFLDRRARAVQEKMVEIRAGKVFQRTSRPAELPEPRSREQRA